MFLRVGIGLVLMNWDRLSDEPPTSMANPFERYTKTLKFYYVLTHFDRVIKVKNAVWRSSINGGNLSHQDRVTVKFRSASERSPESV